MTPMQFTPIKIKRPTSSDKSRIHKDSTSKNSYTLIFPFSSKPPQGWDRLFGEVLESLRDQTVETPRLRVFVHEQELRIICSLDEIAANFVKLKSAVEKTNERYLLSLQQKAEEEETKKRNDQQLKSPEQQAIDQALDMLDYS
jgi:hypothetical protein